MTWLAPEVTGTNTTHRLSEFPIFLTVGAMVISSVNNGSVNNSSVSHRTLPPILSLACHPVSCQDSLAFPPSTGFRCQDVERWTFRNFRGHRKGRPSRSYVCQHGCNQKTISTTLEWFTRLPVTPTLLPDVEHMEDNRWLVPSGCRMAAYGQVRSPPGT